MDNEFAIIARALRQIFWGLICEILAVVLLIGGTLLLIAPMVRGGGNGLFHALLIGCAVLYLLGKAATVIGMIRCLVVPPEVRSARTLVMFAVASQLLNAFLGCMAVIDGQLGVGLIPLQMQSAVYLFSQVILLAGAICFLLFLARVARFIERRDLEGSAMLVLRLGIGLLLGLVLSIAFASATRGTDVVLCCSAIGFCGLALLTVVMYAQLLMNLAAACLHFARLEDAEDRDDGS